MSHVTVMKTEFVLAQQLADALSDVDAKITSRSEDQIAVQLKFDQKHLAVNFKRVGKSFQIEADWWGIQNATRDRVLGKLKQRYVYRAAVATYQPQGFEVIIEHEDADGRMNLVLQKITV